MSIVFSQSYGLIVKNQNFSAIYLKNLYHDCSFYTLFVVFINNLLNVLQLYLKCVFSK